MYKTSVDPTDGIVVFFEKPRSEARCRRPSAGGPLVTLMKLRCNTAAYGGGISTGPRVDVCGASLNAFTSSLSFHEGGSNSLAAKLNVSVAVCEEAPLEFKFRGFSSFTTKKTL